MKGKVTWTTEFNYTEEEVKERIQEEIDYFNEYYADDPFTKEDIPDLAWTFFDTWLDMSKNDCPYRQFDLAYGIVLADFNEVWDKYFAKSAS